MLRGRGRWKLVAFVASGVIVRLAVGRVDRHFPVMAVSTLPDSLAVYFLTGPDAWHLAPCCNLRLYAPVFLEYS